MKQAFGAQRSDAWLRAKVGRISGSGLEECSSYLTRASGPKKPGESSAKRDAYRLKLIAERLTGRLTDTYVTPAMEWGEETENEAVLYYEGVMRLMAEPVGFVIHPDLPFAGASPDRLIGKEGVLEVKAPNTTTHLGYTLAGTIPGDYIPQTAWELACTGRKWVDFVSFDPRIHAESLRFFYRRMGRDELEWTIGTGKEALTLTGEAVIDYFTSEVLKLNAEIEYFFAERGITPIAPFPVELVDEDELAGTKQLPASQDYDPTKGFADQDYAFLDGTKAALIEAI